jgi:drug/metabolite transporter (DMT)-like permease
VLRDIDKTGRGMNSFAISIILVSAAMHAAWNFISKAKAPSAAFFTIATIASALACIPLYVYFAARLASVPLLVWALLLTTAFFHAAYYISLAGAYQRRDISFVYPLTRALPVLWVPIICLFIGYGKPLSPLAIIGIGITALGCVVLPLKTLDAHFLKQYLHGSIWFVAATAPATTGYTILDSIGLEQLSKSAARFSALEGALFFIAFQVLFTLVFLGPYVWLRRSEQHHFKTLMRHSIRFPIWAGIICNVAYMLVLLAMQFASNVSYIVAFRQSSILFGFLLGVWLLKEETTPFKTGGVILILAGLTTAALG